MRTMLELFVVALSLLSASVFAADQPVAAQPGSVQQGESSIHAYRTNDGCGNTDTTNVRFTPALVSDGAKSTKLILRETFEQHEADCHEGFSGKVSVEAMAYSDDFNTGTKLWSLSTEGWTGEEFKDTDGQLYRVSMPGCCGASDTDVYFSLLNGKKLFAATEPLFNIQLIKGDFIKAYVFVALLDNNSSLQDVFTAAAGAKDAVAVVSMGSDQQPGDSVVIHRTTDDSCHPDVLSLIVDGKVAPKGSVDQDRFDSAPAPTAGHGLFIRGRLDCIANGPNDYLVDFEIPVVGGHLTAAGAKSKDAKVSFSTGKN